MGLSYVVVTSVTRDDLPDGGAGAFAETVREIRRLAPGARVEVLVPDFQGDDAAIRAVAEARPDVLNHNLETVPRLYPRVRPGANYQRSLALLARCRRLDPDLPTKSGLMLGLGETDAELRAVLSDLLDVGCRILTLGQYLQPSRAHLPVERYVPPESFEAWRQEALKMGFREVASGPFVRSSYHAGELFQAVAAHAHQCPPRGSAHHETR
jgi:lipoic acid synthetase